MNVPNPLFRWVEGRQKTGYFIFTLAWVTRKWSPIPFDCYIFKYPTGSYIPPHRDPTKSGHHFRFNLILTRPTKGGAFVTDHVLYQNRWMYLFRPDLVTHQVTTVEEGTRYVFSIGWCWPNRYAQAVNQIKNYWTSITRCILSSIRRD